MLFIFAVTLKLLLYMKHIEIKSEGYTYRYDFEPLQSHSETFNPNTTIPIENHSNAS
jgi:hypothetical protein